MREIKFRCWDKKRKSMLKMENGFGFNFLEDGNIEITDYGLIDKNEYDLMQFSGLLDKNGKGKEVYEGDLIQVCPNGYEPREIYEVVWDEERLEWGVKSKIGMITSLWTFDKDFEVIGNIFENENLLK